MEPKLRDSSFLIPQLYALAAKLEGEGQYNLAKLQRCAADAICRQAAYELEMPTNWEELAAEVKKAAGTLSELNTSPELVEAILHGAEIMADGQLPLIEVAPNPYVCRYCGYVTLNMPVVNCPNCRARPDTFKLFNPIYWLDNFDPFEVLEQLQRTPTELAVLLDGLSEEDMNRITQGGGWSVRQAVAHLRDAQGLLDFRIDLMLEQDNPKLESKAVFEWAADEANRPAAVGELFRTYRASRVKTISTLEALPLVEWWRKGQHEEFGEVTVMQQASYFATHELAHFPQIEKLVNDL